MNATWMHTVLAAAFITAFALTGCQVTPPETPGEPDAVEIREYQGQDLSSVDDFREN